MGGFTRPRDLRSSNWFPGGRYSDMGKVYESPPDTAYEPHTVFLLESRYPVRHGIGRVDTYDHVVGVCREGDFEAILKRYNSERAPGEQMEAMDNARWPWGPQYVIKKTKWWAADENPRQIMEELLGEAGVDHAYLDESGKFEDFAEDVDAHLNFDDPAQPMSKVMKAKALEQAKLEKSLLMGAPKSAAPSSVRAFHTSAATYGAHSYNEDHIVPDFYVQHKRRKDLEADDGTADHSQTSQSHHGEALPGSLMEQLSDSILSDDLAASTMRRLKNKTPHEHYNEEGILVHPSGFIPATPGPAQVPMSEKRVRDTSLQTAAVAERVLEEGSYADISAHTRLQTNKVPYEVIEEDGTVRHPSGYVPPTAVHQFKYSDSSSLDNHVQDAVQRQRRRATTIHVSEAEMAERQRKSDAMFGQDEDDAELIAELKEAAGKAPGAGQKRGIHTSAVLRASEVPHFPFQLQDDASRSPPPHLAGVVPKGKEVKFPKAGKAPKAGKSLLPNPPPEISQDIKALRERYLPTLNENPFWRPLLSITTSTRPLAVTLARLSRARARGLPFYASVNDDDRKTHESYPARMRNMRIDRMEDLTVRMAELLSGARGGFIGIRFNTQDRGRGIGGEGLEKPLPKESRTIKIGVGNWYKRAEEVKEAFKLDAIERVGQIGVGLNDIGETFDVSGLDDHGRRVDDKTGEIIPWREAKPMPELSFMDEYNMKALDVEEAAEEENTDIIGAWKNENEMRRQKKAKRQDLARNHAHEIASHLAQRHRSVMNP